jgi:hypothetical protein
MDSPLDDVHARDAQIARQLPVISAQQDSLAAVLLTRWLRLTVDHGPASLEVTRAHGREHWGRRWRAPNHRARAVHAPTLAELFVRLLAELPEEERQHWAAEAFPSAGRSRRSLPPQTLYPHGHRCVMLKEKGPSETARPSHGCGHRLLRRSRLSTYDVPASVSPAPSPWGARKGSTGEPRRLTAPESRSFSRTGLVALWRPG